MIAAPIPLRSRVVSCMSTGMPDSATTITKTCTQCGRGFEPIRASGKYCSAKCRKAASRTLSVTGSTDGPKVSVPAVSPAPSDLPGPIGEHPEAYEAGYAAAIARKPGPFSMMTPWDLAFYRGWNRGRLRRSKA